MKIAIDGTCYVGLPNAILLAQRNEVVALDIVTEKVAMLKQIDVSPSTIKRLMQELKHEGKIRRIGAKRGGEWEVVS